MFLGALNVRKLLDVKQNYTMAGAPFFFLFFLGLAEELSSFCFLFFVRGVDGALEFPRLFELLVVVLVLGVVWALLPVVGRPGLVVPAPVALADDPGQDVHLVVQVGRELGADEVGRAGPLAAGDELHAIVVAAVLCRQRGGLQRQHGADAVAGTGLVDLQLLFRAAGVLPAEVAARGSVVDVGRAVRHLGRVGARAAGQVVGHLGHVLLQEVALAVHPALTAVGVCGGAEEPLQTILYDSGPIHTLRKNDFFWTFPAHVSSNL